LCKIGDVQGRHPHCFRDTLAAEFLLAGASLERVSILLGRSSVKISERHYPRWVQAHQTRLESDLARAPRNDSTAQAEPLRDNARALPLAGLYAARWRPDRAALGEP